MDFAPLLFSRERFKLGLAPAGLFLDMQRQCRCSGNIPRQCEIWPFRPAATGVFSQCAALDVRVSPRGRSSIDLPSRFCRVIRNFHWQIDDHSRDEREPARGGKRPPGEDRGAGRCRLLLHADSRRHDRCHLVAADGSKLRRAAGVDEHRHHRLYADDGGLHSAVGLARRSLRRAPCLPDVDRRLHRRLAVLRAVRQSYGIRAVARRPGGGQRADDAGRAHHRAEERPQVRTRPGDCADHLAGADRAR